jgi:uncharacterized protein (DUF2336 family)
VTTSSDLQKPADAAETEEAARIRRAAAPATPAAVMRKLAADPSPTVRATLAMNPAAPPEIDRALAADDDERVRVLLARKLAALAPTLSSDAQVRLQRQALDTLMTLVSDEAVRVRAAIAETVQDLPDVPRAMILRLARDAQVMVCEPVIRFSPMLTPNDLLTLLASAPSPVTALAVARRADIDEAVSDAIAATADSEAIRVLLANRSAHIREATLDALIAQAQHHTDWHEPLVNRPALPQRAARTLSEIVATHLLDVLAARTDLDPAVTRDLKARLIARLETPATTLGAGSDTDEATALGHAKSSAASGTLDEGLVMETMRRGDTHQVMALLAVAAGVPVSVVERAAELRSPKGLVSLAWRAGFTMRVAIGLQTLLARLPPNAVLQAGSGGGFPLTVEEMRWQIDFLARMGR